MNAITRTWDQLKADCTGLRLRMMFTEDADLYTVFWEDGELRGELQIWRVELPWAVAEAVDQTSNDAALADFEANFKTTCNAPVAPQLRTSDARDIVALTITKRATAYAHRAFSFKTATLDTIRNVNPVTGASWGDATVKLFDAQGAETQTPADAVRTQIDWEAQYSYEIIGGSIDIDPTLTGGTTNAWFISAVGVPDYPPEAYGSLPFVSEINVELISGSRFGIDGRAAQYMAYQYGGHPHTNLLRFTFKHPAGEQRRFQIHIDHYI